VAVAKANMTIGYKQTQDKDNILRTSYLPYLKVNIPTCNFHKLSSVWYY